MALDYPELLGGKYSPRLFKCDVCRECFLYKDGMIVHVNLIHECWCFQCDVCGECFLSRDDMIWYDWSCELSSWMLAFSM